jgi:hypothetical protein
MLNEKDLMLALKRHWDYAGRDEDIAHEIYHDDAMLELPNPANGSKAWKTSGNGAASTLLT